METWLDTTGALAQLSQALGPPTHVLLLAAFALSLWECGLFGAERFRGLAALGGDGDLSHAERVARARVDRADILGRVGPMFGLMGTLIPLGPALTALGRGDVDALARSVTAAFDTTVLGLLVGILGFALGRLRRAHYDRLFDAASALGVPRAEASAESTVVVEPVDGTV